MASPNDSQAPGLRKIGLDLISQALPLVVSAGGLAALVFGVGAAVSVARFSAAGLPWEQAVNAAAEGDIRAVGLVWLFSFGVLGLLAVALAYVASPQGRPTAAMYYALIVIAWAEALAAWQVAREGDVWDLGATDVEAMAVICLAALAAALVVLGLHIPAHRRALEARNESTEAEHERFNRWREQQGRQPRSYEPLHEPQATRWRLLVLLVLAAAAMGAVLMVGLRLAGLGWPPSALIGFAALTAGAGLALGMEWTRVCGPLGAATKSSEAKQDELLDPPIPLAFWAFCLLAFLSAGAGVAVGMLLESTWLGLAVTFTGVLGLLTIRVAELSDGFRWYGVCVFLAVGLFGGVVQVLRMVDDPQLQPVAFLMKEGGDLRAVEGAYVGESDKRFWFASVAVDDCDGDPTVRENGGRLRSVAAANVATMSIGPQMPMDELAQEARAMLDALRTERAGSEPLMGPGAVRDTVSLSSVSAGELGPGRWVPLADAHLGERPTLTLRGRRLQTRLRGDSWQFRLPRTAQSGPVYADCAERTNRAFLTVPQRPLPLATATRDPKGGWSFDGRGSVDVDGQIDTFTWTVGDSTKSGRTAPFPHAPPRGEAILELGDDTGLSAKRVIPLRGRLVRVYASDLLFDFDRARLSPDGAARLRTLRDDVRGARLVRVRVHTDERGSHAHNLTLSKLRARAIKEALLEGRIAENRQDVCGRGETEPERPGEHRRNRRVLIVVHPADEAKTPPKRAQCALARSP